MPALPSVPGVIRVALKWTLETGHTAGSRFFFSYTGGPPSAADCEAVAAGVATAWSDSLNGNQSSEWTLSEVNVVDLSSDTANEGSAFPAAAGGNEGGIISVELATLMNCEIARRYRGGRPRIYLPIGTENDISDDRVTWGATFISGVNGNWAGFKDAVLALTGIGMTLTDHVNVSYYSGFASSQNPVTKRWRNIPTPRSSAVVDGIIQTQARPEITQQRRRRTALTA